MTNQPSATESDPQLIAGAEEALAKLARDASDRRSFVAQPDFSAGSRVLDPATSTAFVPLSAAIRNDRPHSAAERSGGSPGSCLPSPWSRGHAGMAVLR